MGLSLSDVKVLTLFLIAISSFLASIIPWIISAKVKHALDILSLSNALAGGIVLGAGLSHVFPAALESFEAYFEGEETYPYAFLISGFVLLLLLSIDKVFLSGHAHSDPSAVVIIHENSHGSVDNITKTAPRTGAGKNATLLGEVIPKGKDKQKEDLIHRERSPLVASSSNEHVVIEQIFDDGTSKISPSDTASLLKEDALEAGTNANTTEVVLKNLKKAEEKNQHQQQVMQAYIFVGAICLHSLFEGLGMGAEEEADQMYSLLLAVVSHKLMEAFAVGLSVFYARFPSITNVIILTIYTAATPLGIVGGMVATKFSTAHQADLVIGIFTSIAGGSFLYISLIEIIPGELAKPKYLIIKVGLVFLGWGFMAFLALYA